MPDRAAGRRRGWQRTLPVMRGVLPIERSRVPADVLAGFTLAALGIPEVLGYARIAGMPVVTGLYTMLLPIAVFAVLGSSRHLVVLARRMNTQTPVVPERRLSRTVVFATPPPSLSRPPTATPGPATSHGALDARGTWIRLTS